MFSGKLRLIEDDDDFTGDIERTRANLSNIFGVSLNTSDQQNLQNIDKDHTLKYVPPKQTKALTSVEQSDTDKNASWSIQIAKVVSAFKLVNEVNVAEGKVGLAILKSKDDQYKLILYRTKNKVISSMDIIQNTKMFIKKPYLQFRDDFQVFWSVLFENGEENVVIDLFKGKIILEYQDDVDSSKTANISERRTSKTQQEEQMSSNNNIKERVENYSSDEKLKETKAQILSRMAKMGQPLPKLATTTTDFSDSSDTESKVKTVSKPIAIPRKPKVQQQQPPQKVVAIAQPSTTTQLTPIVTNLSGFNPAFNVESQYLNMLFTENRTQNTELRMNLSKIETKIEKVLDKIDLIDSRESKGSTRKCKEDEILELEEKLLLLKKENRALNIKIEDLERNQNVKQCENENITEDEIVKFQPLIVLFDVKIDSFSSSNDLFKELLQKYESHCSELKATIESNNKTLDDKNVLIDSLKLQYEQEKSELIKENEELKVKVNDMEKKLEDIKEENKNLNEQKEKSEEISEKAIDAVLKDIMNNFYQDLVNKFEDKKNFTSEEILKICGRAIIQETSNVIKRKNIIKSRFST